MNIKLDIEYRVPVLTALEVFCYRNIDRGSSVLATELNRTDTAIVAAWNRADDKVKELQALVRKAHDIDPTVLPVLRKELTKVS